MILEKLVKQKDFITSTNIETGLYKLLVDCGIKEELIVSGKYNKEIGDAKERIYKEFSNLLGFEYFWEDYYHVKKQ